MIFAGYPHGNTELTHLNFFSQVRFTTASCDQLVEVGQVMHATKKRSSFVDYAKIFDASTNDTICGGVGSDWIG